MKPFRFGVVCNQPLSGEAWQRMARQVESNGYSTLLTGDHLAMPSALARAVSAADATTVLRVGTLVLNNDLRHPMRLLQEASTVDQLTGGRLELGIGSGWDRADYEQLGVPRDPPHVRAARLDSTLQQLRQTWAASRDLPPAHRPVQMPHPPVLVGGQSEAVLTVAARHADIVGITGVTLSDGSYQPTGVSSAAVRQRVDLVRAAAGERRQQIEFSVLVDAVFVGPSGEAIAEKVGALRRLAPEVVMESPFTLIGEADRLVDKLAAAREDIGLSYVVVSHTVAAALAPVVAALAGK